MTSREIILANLNHENPPRPGLTFDGGRINDFVWGGMDEGMRYHQKRWIDGNVEYYDDAWGNLWKRMVGGCVKSEMTRSL